MTPILCSWNDMINGAVFTIRFQPFSRHSFSEGASFSLHEASNTSLDLG